MDRDAALTRLQSVEREIAALHALRGDLLVSVASSAPVIEELLVLDPRPGHDEERRIRIDDAAREEIAAALRWSPVAAHARIDEARLLAGPLPATAAALREGAISPGHVAVIAEAARRLPGRFASAQADRDAHVRACAQLECRVLPTALRGTISMTRRAVNRAVLVIDADGAARRRREERCTRDVHVTDELDGISTLIARMATEDAHAVLTAVRQTAAAVGAADLAAGERRAEALAALVLGTGESGHSRHITLDVVIPVDALLGGESGDAELGAWPVTADLVRDLLGDPAVTAAMRRLVVDPTTGHLLDRGRRAYEIPQALRDFIVTRDGTCRFPGCARRAAACQIDHAIPFDDGGETSIANLGALCVRHHQLKTHGGWDITDSRTDGSCTWTSPAGRQYERPARAVLPAHDPPPF